ncbi:MAG: hypothetical protein ACHQUA_00865 [Microgenomates group bacterium]
MAERQKQTSDPNDPTNLARMLNNSLKELEKQGITTGKRVDKITTKIAEAKQKAADQSRRTV